MLICATFLIWVVVGSLEEFYLRGCTPVPAFSRCLSPPTSGASRSLIRLLYNKMGKLVNLQSTDQPDLSSTPDQPQLLPYLGISNKKILEFQTKNGETMGDPYLLRCFPHQDRSKVLPPRAA